MANRASLGDPLAARSPIAQYGTRAGIGLKSEGQPGMIGVSQLDVTPGGKMRNLLILGVLILVVAAPVRSQEYPKAEAFGGYQYLRLNPGGTNCQGFGGSAAGNLNDWFGVVGDFGYCKVTGLPSGTSAHAINYLFGPRVTYRSAGSFTPFAHVLFGGDDFGSGGGGTANSLCLA